MARFGMAAAVLALMAAPLFAQESTEQLKKELEQLRAEVDGLKALNQTKEIPAAGGAQVDALSPDDSPLMTLFKSTKLSGFIDMSYGYSLRAGLPVLAPLQAYSGRVFDIQGNTFALQAVQLNLERAATKDMILGYHIELAMGVDPFLYNGGGGLFALGAPPVTNGLFTGIGSNFVGIQEGWIEILAPIGEGLDIKIGKMATLAGYEVIESMNNMNFSRGFLFGFAIPFTHTGVRANYAVNEMFNFTLGFSNGWNSNFDIDNGKTLEAQIAVTPMKDLKVFLTSYYGTESLQFPGSGHSMRFLLDLVVEWKMDKLTVAAEFDWGVSEIPGGGPNPAWGGVALYGKYQVNDFFAGALRAEYFSEGFNRTVAEPAGGIPSSAIAGARNRVIEFTLTGEFKIASTLIMRIEYRHDESLVPVFFTGTTGQGQDSISAEWILPF